MLFYEWILDHFLIVEVVYVVKVVNVVGSRYMQYGAKINYTISIILLVLTGRKECIRVHSFLSREIRG